MFASRAPRGDLVVGAERATNAVDKRLGKRIRARRLQLGMSQEELADTLGVTFQQVQKYEKGINRVAASRLFDIAVAIDLPISRLFKGIGSSRHKSLAEDAGSVLHEVLATPEGVQVLTLFSAIKSQSVRRRVVELIQAVVEE